MAQLAMAQLAMAQLKYLRLAGMSRRIGWKTLNRISNALYADLSPPPDDLRVCRIDLNRSPDRGPNRCPNLIRRLIFDQLVAVAVAVAGI